MPSTTELQRQADELQKQWDSDARWKGLRRDYTALDVVRLRGSVQEEHTLARRDQITWSEGKEDAPDWFAPIVADAEAGFGGVLNAFELMKAMIGAGASGVHWEDQLSSAKKCGHLGGKVLIPTAQHVKTLNAARLAADVEGVPTLVVARTDAQAATLITSDVDERDRQYVTGDRTAEGFYRVTNGIDPCITRPLAYAP